MRKLNRKGFTLVELLAVIIILAIVVGITIPAVLKTINTSRQKAGEDAAQIAANWIDEQYTVSTVDKDSIDDAFKNACGVTGSGCTGASYTYPTGDNLTALIVATGMKTADVTNIGVKINASGKSCVEITAATNGAYWVTNDATKTAAGSQKYTSGAGC